MKRTILITSIAIAALSFLIFLIVPNATSTLSFSGKTFLSGEFYRILTFSFVHVNLLHLIENILALGVVSLLAYELGIRGKHFVLIFILSGIIIGITQAIIAPLIILAGASLGIHAILGAIAMKGTKFISEYILIPSLALSTFLILFFNFFTCQDCITRQVINQSFFHFFGFISGLALFLILVKYDRYRKTTCLRKTST